MSVFDLSVSLVRSHHVKAALGEDVAEECNPAHRCPQQGAFVYGNGNCSHLTGYIKLLLFRCKK